MDNNYNDDRELTLKELDQINAGVPNPSLDNSFENKDISVNNTSKKDQVPFGDIDDFDLLAGAEDLFSDIEKSEGRHR